MTTKGFDTRYTRNLASISVQMFSIPNYLATLRPSLKSHSSATVLVMFLSFLANPAIQSPLLHLRIPPSPALIGSPNIDPFVFSFTYPIGGLIHFTWIWILLGLFGLLGTNGIKLHSLFYTKSTRAFFHSPSLKDCLISLKLDSPNGLWEQDFPRDTGSWEYIGSSAIFFQPILQG